MILNYNDFRSQIKNGDVLLYDSVGWINRYIIKPLLKTKYSHAGSAVWWNDRLMVMEAVPAGIRLMPLSVNVENYYGSVDLYRWSEQISDKKRKSMIIHAQEQLGKPYAKREAFKFGLKLLFKEKLDTRDAINKASTMFCSWFIADEYNFIGLDVKKNVADAYIHPDDFIEKFQNIGTLKIFKE